MKNQIENLEIGASVRLELPVDDVRNMARMITGRFRFIRESNDSCLVIRIEENEKSLRKTVIDAIESMVVFDVQRIHGDIQYIRSIVSRYNNEHGRAVKVNKIQGVATLTENVMARMEISAAEFEQIEIDFNQKLEILRGRIR